MKAYVTQVQIGNLTIDGLMDEGGQYWVAIPQLAALNLVRRGMSLKRLEDRLGLGFPSGKKMNTELNSRAVNAISITDFERLLAKLDRAGNKIAQDLRDDLVGLSLHQLYSDAFGVRFEAENRQLWLTDRLGGREIRRTLTDSIRDYLASNGKGDARGYYAQITNQIYLGIFGMDANQIRTALSVTEGDATRDYLNPKELRTIATVEEVVMNLVDEGTNPFEAVVQALTIMKKSRLILKGN